MKIPLAIALLLVFCSFAIAANHSPITARQAHQVFSAVTSGAWSEIAELHARYKLAKGFGSSIAVQGDTLVVGSPDGYQGRVLVFIKPKTGWADAKAIAILTASQSNGSHFFGHSVAIDGDGDTIVVGDPDTGDYEGSAYVFVKPKYGWKTMTETATLSMSNGESNDQFGTSVSVSGNTIAVGAPYAPCCQSNG